MTQMATVLVSQLGELVSRLTGSLRKEIMDYYIKATGQQ